MNIEVLIEQLTALYTDPGQPRASSLEILGRIHSYLLNTAMDLDQRCNMLEMYLITSINDAIDINKIKLLQLSLKIVLFHRGYYTDTAGHIEKTLLLKPFEIEHKKVALVNTLGREFVNKITFKISACLNSAKTTPEKIQDLINLLYKKSKKYHNGQLEYINWCLSKAKEHILPQSRIEHSLWASAILESLIALEQLTSKNASANFGGTEQMRARELAEQIKMQTCRIVYFIARSKEQGEPIGYYAENQIASLVNFNPQHSIEKIKFDYMALHRRAALENDGLINQAYNLILKYKENHNHLQLALDIAHRLIENYHPLGIFFKCITLSLGGSVSQEDWKNYLEYCQNTVIPYNWRSKVAELWLCLSDYFFEHINEAEHSHYKECALICAKLVNEKYGAKARLKSRLQLAKINHHDTQIKILLQELQKLNDAHHAIDHENSDYEYPRQLQYALVNYLLQPNADVEKFVYLMSENYPFGIEIMIKLLLNRVSQDHTIAKEAVTAKYDANHTNPLKLCNLLRTQSFNRHAMIWAPIYCDAIENEFLAAQVAAWRRLRLNNNDIEYKLYSYARSILFAEIYDPKQVVPCGIAYLKEVDKKLLEIVINMMREIQENRDSPLFAFTRGRPGLLEGCFAELALNENNFFLLEQIAQLSINACISKITSPRRAQQLVKSPLLNRVEQEEESPVRRSRASSALPAFSLEGASAPLRSSIRSIPNSAPDFDSPEGNKRGSLIATQISPRSKSLSKKSGEQYASPPSTSPRALDSSLTRMTPLMARVTVAVNEQNTDLIPSHLGYFYYAQAIYSSRLKENKSPQSADVQLFLKNLELAKNAPNKQELAYICARIWLSYSENNKDKIWITDAECQQLQLDIKQFNPHQHDVIILEKDKIIDFLIITKIKTLLETALNNTQDFSGKKHEMFPPAAYIYAKDVYYWMTFYYDNDKNKLNSFVKNLVQYLDEAIGKYGYLPALYTYALVVNSNLDYFRHEGTLAFLLTKIKQYLETSERYIYIEPGQKRELTENIAALEIVEQRIEAFGKILINGDNNTGDKILAKIFNFIHDDTVLAKTCLVSKSFSRVATQILDRRLIALGPKEKTLAMKPSIFSEKSCLVTFKDDHQLTHQFTMIYKIAAHQDEKSGFYFDCNSKFFFDMLKSCLRFAEKFYIYNKKITLVQECTQYQPERHAIFVSHADIAIIAMLKLLQTQSKEAESTLKKMKISALYDLLKEAKSLPSSTWQGGERTHKRIEIIINQYDLELSRKIAKKIPGLAKQSHGSRPSSRGELRREYSDPSTAPPLLDPLTLLSPRSQRRDSLDSPASPANLDSSSQLAQLPTRTQRKNGSATRLRSDSLISRSRAGSFSATPPTPSSNNSSGSTPDSGKK